MSLAILANRRMSSAVPLQSCNTADVRGFAASRVAIAMKFV